MISTIGTREEARFLAERIGVIGGALKRREEPLDADGDALEQVAAELLQVANTIGDWPGELTKGRVLVWAGSIQAVTHHIEEQVGHELEATVGFLRRTAAELQGHASGLRSTGQWAVAGEFTAPEEAAPEREIEDVADSDAPTEPHLVRAEVLDEKV